MEIDSMVITTDPLARAPALSPARSVEGRDAGQGSRGAAPAARGTAPPSGPVLFARYAFGPNRLGLCGPEDWRSLLELGIAGEPDEAGGPGPARQSSMIDRELRHLAAGFEGAFPYLELIARAHGIDDPLDGRVVEAYWIGNTLSDRVDPKLMAISMSERFRGQLDAGAWRWLADKPAAGARPTHAFHVLEVFPRVGLARGSQVTDAVALMDSCRIRWGRVVDRRGERLLVNVVPLQLVDGRLILGPEQPQLVRRWLDGSGFVTDVAVGDTVSVHWDWACEVMSGPRLMALQRRTLRAMEIANQTI